MPTATTLPAHDTRVGEADTCPIKEPLPPGLPEPKSTRRAHQSCVPYTTCWSSSATRHVVKSLCHGASRRGTVFIFSLAPKVTVASFESLAFFVEGGFGDGHGKVGEVVSRCGYELSSCRSWRSKLFGYPTTVKSNTSKQSEPKKRKTQKSPALTPLALEKQRELVDRIMNKTRDLSQTRTVNAPHVHKLASPRRAHPRRVWRDRSAQHPVISRVGGNRRSRGRVDTGSGFKRDRWGRKFRSPRRDHR